MCGVRTSEAFNYSTSLLMSDSPKDLSQVAGAISFEVVRPGTRVLLLLLLVGVWGLCKNRFEPRGGREREREIEIGEGASTERGREEEQGNGEGERCRLRVGCNVETSLGRRPGV